jgi:hypothetical protein
MVRSPRYCCEMAVLLASLALLASGCGGSYEAASSTPQASAKAPAAASPEPPAASLPQWRPNAALMEQLGPYQEIEGYRIRVPRDFSPLHSSQKLPIGMKLFGWRSPSDGENTGTTLEVKIAIPPPEEEKMRKMSLAEIAVGAIGSGDRKECMSSGMSSGQIGDLTFMKTNWTEMIQGSAKLRGFSLVCKDGLTIVLIRASGAESNVEQNLKLALTAALTFRKKGAADAVPASPLLGSDEKEGREEARKRA